MSVSLETARRLVAEFDKLADAIARTAIYGGPDVESMIWCDPWHEPGNGPEGCTCETLRRFLLEVRDP